MKKLLALLLLPACTTLHYKDGETELTRTAFGTQLQVQTIEVAETPAGKRITLHGLESEQAQTVRAVAEGVAKGMAIP